MTPAADPLHVVRGACGHDCPDTCSWVVEVRDGTAERLSGDPAHPFTRGTFRAGALSIEMHPDDARARGVGAGDLVRVWNRRGEVRALCAVSGRVRPGVAWMPFGGFTDASGAHRSVNVLTPVEPTDWGGGSGLYDAFVEVAPAVADATPIVREPSAELAPPSSTQTRT